MGSAGDQESDIGIGQHPVALVIALAESIAINENTCPHRANAQKISHCTDAVLSIHTPKVWIGFLDVQVSVAMWSLNRNYPGSSSGTGHVWHMIILVS